MAFRFRKSIKVLPGVRVNIGKRGASVSLGTRGARLTVGPRGTTTSLGIPGTGLSHRSRATWGPSGASARGSSDSGSAGLLGCLVVLGLFAVFASCLVCASSDGSRSSNKRPMEASASTPVSEHPEPRERQEQGLAASAPAVIHAFGDGGACRALESCRVLEASSDASGTTWRLASASNVSDVRVELQVTPEGRIASVGLTGDPSGNLAALVLEDLQVSEDDRPALAWHMREHLSAEAIEDAKPLCGAGICVVAGLESGRPAARLRLDPTIEANRRAMKRAATAAARAAARAARLQARHRAEEPVSTPRTQPRADDAKPRRPSTEFGTPPPKRSCCKYCSTGIPCGDTCIAANRTCHKGPGCAC